MEEHIYIYNKEIGMNHLFPYDVEEVEKVKKENNFPFTIGELIKGIYLLSFEPKKYKEQLHTLAILYLHQSKTYQLGKAMGQNFFPMYVDKGTGDGFVRLCGASDYEEDKWLEKGQMMIINTLDMFGIHPSKTTKQHRGSNFTPKKKKRKKR